MLAAAAALYKAITSPVGEMVMFALLVVAVLAGVGTYERRMGYDAGRAEVQATLDATVKADAAALQRCHDNGATLQKQVDDQNARFAAMQKQASAQLAATQANLKAIQALASHNSARLARLEAPLTGPNSCANLEQLDQRLVQDLSPP